MGIGKQKESLAPPLWLPPLPADLKVETRLMNMRWRGLKKFVEKGHREQQK